GRLLDRGRCLDRADTDRLAALLRAAHPPAGGDAAALRVALAPALELLAHSGPGKPGRPLADRARTGRRGRAARRNDHEKPAGAGGGAMSDSVVNRHSPAVAGDRASSEAAAWNTTAALDVVVVGVVALALGLIHLARPSLWVDESFTARAMGDSYV